MGRTKGKDCSRPMIESSHGKDGAMSADGRIRGCYLHGLFGSDAYRAAFLQRFGAQPGGSGHLASVNDALDSIAVRLEDALDIDGLLSIASDVPN